MPGCSAARARLATLWPVPAARRACDPEPRRAARRSPSSRSRSGTSTPRPPRDARLELAPTDPGHPRPEGDRRLPPGTDRPAAVAMAKGVLAEDPGNVTAHMVVIADRLQAGDTGRRARPRGDRPRRERPTTRDCTSSGSRILEDGRHRRGRRPSSRDGPPLPGEPRLRGRARPVAPGERRPRRRRGGASAAADATPDESGPGPALTLAQFLLEVRGAGRRPCRARDRLAAAAGRTPPARPSYAPAPASTSPTAGTRRRSPRCAA